MGKCLPVIEKIITNQQMQTYCHFIKLGKGGVVSTSQNMAGVFHLRTNLTLDRQLKKEAEIFLNGSPTISSALCADEVM